MGMAILLPPLHPKDYRFPVSTMSAQNQEGKRILIISVERARQGEICANKPY